MADNVSFSRGESQGTSYRQATTGEADPAPYNSRGGVGMSMEEPHYNNRRPDEPSYRAATNDKFANKYAYDGREPGAGDQPDGKKSPGGSPSLTSELWRKNKVKILCVLVAVFSLLFIIMLILYFQVRCTSASDGPLAEAQVVKDDTTTPFPLPTTPSQVDTVQKTILSEQIKGRNVTQFVLTNSQGLTVTLINYGARITRINKNNQEYLKGYQNIQDYTYSSLGAVAGRLCDYERPSFTIGGTAHSVNTSIGYEALFWDGVSYQADSVTFTLDEGTIPTSERVGLPGDVTAMVTYTLKDNGELVVRGNMKIDRGTTLTVASMCHDLRFNLKGRNVPNLTGHRLFYPGTEFYNSVTGTYKTLPSQYQFSDGATETLETRVDRFVTNPATDPFFTHYKVPEYAGAAFSIRLSDNTGSARVSVATTLPLLRMEVFQYPNEEDAIQLMPVGLIPGTTATPQDHYLLNNEPGSQYEMTSIYVFE